ncbi:MAG: hypothetical protein IPG34_09255 [Rhodocyclaceae bacterium]|nr:hypothetical protein [Rhodocyclaceae bacterium]
MLQPKHPLTALVSNLVQGVFRAGHLSLIALGLFALSQLVHVPMASTRSGQTIDALGGSAEALVVSEPAAEPAYKAWFVGAKTASPKTSLPSAAQSPRQPLKRLKQRNRRSARGRSRPT